MLVVTVDTISYKNQLHVLMIFGGMNSNCRMHQSREKTSGTQSHNLKKIIASQALQLDISRYLKMLIVG